MSEAGSAIRPSFPFAAAALCAACVAVAAWLWVRHSYCRDVTPGSFPELEVDEEGPLYQYLAPPDRLLLGRYVALRVDRVTEARPVGEGAGPYGPGARRLWVGDGRNTVAVVLPPSQEAGELEGKGAVFTGRVIEGHRDEWRSWPVSPLAVDTTASRFTGASVAGLAVGAWGVFLFALALAHWRNPRPGGSGGGERPPARPLPTRRRLRRGEGPDAPGDDGVSGHMGVGDGRGELQMKWCRRGPWLILEWI